MPASNPITFDAFTKAYIEALLWSSNDPKSGEPLDRNFSAEDLSVAAKKKIIADCKSFQGKNWDDIAENTSRAGHDFWLTRNRHGAGFWDGEWPNAGKRLTEAAHKYGELTPYVFRKKIFFMES